MVDIAWFSLLFIVKVTGRQESDIRVHTYSDVEKAAPDLALSPIVEQVSDLIVKLL